ncbi:MAG: rhamnulokinase [Firmicutes bacterium]|nr:rhamnulokinase [Bacillota bacterium]
MKKVLAFDFGFSSGRAIIFTFDGEKLESEEISRFQNIPKTIGRVRCWDVDYLFEKIDQSVLTAIGKGVCAIGIDTWGVDAAIVRGGEIIVPPINYRDDCITGAAAETEKLMPFETLYSISGIQRQDFNTVNRFRVFDKTFPGWRDKGGKMLLMPDLFAMHLTGSERAELTNCSTTSMLNAKTRDFDDRILKAASIDREMLPPIIMPGEQYGYLKPGYTDKKIPVVAVCTHDTASAVAAVPVSGKKFAYISSGTWSLLGTETSSPQTGKLAMQYNFSNEIGYGGKIRLLKNIMGLFLLQETRRELNEKGENIGFSEISARASAVQTDKFINPDDPMFLARGPMLCRVDEYLAKTGQKPAQSDDERFAIIYLSLALTYKRNLERLEQLTGTEYTTLHIVGGGTQDRLLNRMTANAVGIPVITGPIEATAMGNAIVQLISLGEIDGIDKAREIVAKSSKLTEYLPENNAEMQEKYQKFISITEK